MTANELLSDAIITRQLLLQKVGNGLSKQVSDIYTDVANDIIKAIRIGDTINIKNMNKVIKELKAIVNPNLNPIYDDLFDLAHTESTFIASTVNEIAGASLFNAVLTDKALDDVLNTSLVEGATIKEWFSSLDASIQTDLQRTIRKGVVIGTNNNDLANDVLKVLNTNISHAKTITRTAVATIANETRLKDYDNNQDVIKGIEWNATLDSRTRLEHAILDGSVWDIKTHKGTNEKGKQNTYKTAPLGWNCRCLMIPVMKSWKEIGIDKDNLTDKQRASMDGQVSAGTNFDKWLSQKDKSFQEQYLGKGRYDLYKSGKITLSDLVNQQGEVLSVKELKNL